MRWLSPPDSVPEPRDSVRYSSPTSFRNCSRSLISLRIRTAISFCFLVSFFGRASNQSRAVLIDSAVDCEIVKSLIFTLSASGRSRSPLQVGQGAADW